MEAHDLTLNRDTLASHISTQIPRMDSSQSSFYQSEVYIRWSLLRFRTLQTSTLPSSTLSTPLSLL